MACDIRLHQELKLNGQWQHYRDARLTRNYKVFAKMAGVRGNETPIAPPRGLPIDVTTLTKFCAEYDGEDGHAHSWLGAKEITELEVWIKSQIPDKPWMFEQFEWGYLLGSPWSTFTVFPGEIPSAIEDIRFVFWFMD